MAIYLSLPTFGYHVSTPHTVAMNAGTNTIDLRAKVAMNTWIPSGNATFIGLWGAAGSGDQYVFYIDNTGTMQSAWKNAGGGYNFPNSGVVLGYSAGTVKWVRCLITITAGTCDFYVSDDGSTWSQVGTQQTGFTTTAVAVPGTLPSLRIAEDEPGTNQWLGKVYRGTLIVGGVTIADIDFSQQVVGSANTTFLGNAGETWTIANSAIIAQDPPNPPRRSAVRRA